MRTLVTYPTLTEEVTGGVILDYYLFAIRPRVGVLAGGNRTAILRKSLYAKPIRHINYVDAVRMKRHAGSQDHASLD